VVVRLAELTWEEAQAAAQAGAIALLPVGSTEAHGPHLPLSTDVVIAEGMARRLQASLDAAQRRSVILPALAYAVTEYADEFGGTLTVPATTAVGLVRDVCLAAQRKGFAHVCLVNAHLEPAHVETLRRAVAEVEAGGGQTVAFPDCLERRFARTLSEEFKRGACHAGQYETSLVLAESPQLVRQEVARQLAENAVDLARAMKAGLKTFTQAGAPRAYFGAPAAASAEHGEEQYGRLVDMCLTVIGELWPDPAPGPRPAP
jgi:creatinine amidohydrolase